jgi:hypothetical protein
VNIRLLTFLSTLGILLLCSVPASAVPIPVVSDVLKACQVLESLDPNGNIITQVQCFSTIANEGDEGKVFILDKGIGNVDTIPTLVFDSSGQISDAFGVVGGDLAFVSDPGPEGLFGTVSVDGCGKTFHCVLEGSGVLGVLDPNGNIITVNGNIITGDLATFDLSGYLTDDAKKNGWSATFTSDADVPEPGSVGLVLGLGALGLCAWKRRRTAA